MKTVYFLKKNALKLDYVPEIEHLIHLRRIIRATKQGLRLCAVEAPEDFEGFWYSHARYDFFETRAELLDAIAKQANAHAAQLGELKNAAVTLMCDAHDLLRAEQTK